MSSMKCMACQMTLYSTHEYQQHMESKKHAKKLVLLAKRLKRQQIGLNQPKPPQQQTTFQQQSGYEQQAPNLQQQPTFEQHTAYQQQSTFQQQAVYQQQTLHQQQERPYQQQSTSYQQQSTFQQEQPDSQYSLGQGRPIVRASSDQFHWRSDQFHSIDSQSLDPTLFSGATATGTKVHRRPKLYNCQKCDYSSNYRANMHKHVQKMHINLPKVIPCAMCDRMFTTEDKMRWHLKGHIQEPCGDWNTRDPVYCTICAAKFTGPEEAERHYNKQEHIKRSKTARLRQEGRLNRFKEFREEDVGSDQKKGCFYCSCCHVAVDSYDQMYIHTQGSRHKKMLEQRKQHMEEMQMDRTAKKPSPDSTDPTATIPYVDASQILPFDQMFPAAGTSVATV